MCVVCVHIVTRMQSGVQSDVRSPVCVKLTRLRTARCINPSSKRRADEQMWRFGAKWA